MLSGWNWDESQISGVGRLYGIRSIEDSVQRGVKCRYCGNLYPREMMKEYRNCPTCAGGWQD